MFLYLPTTVKEINKIVEELVAKNNLKKIHQLKLRTINLIKMKKN